MPELSEILRFSGKGTVHPLFPNCSVTLFTRSRNVFSWTIARINYSPDSDGVHNDDGFVAGLAAGSRNKLNGRCQSVLLPFRRGERENFVGKISGFTG